MGEEYEAEERRPHQREGREESEVVEQLRAGEDQPEEGADGGEAPHGEGIGQLAHHAAGVVGVVAVGQHVNRVAEGDAHHGGPGADGNRGD